MDIPSLTWRVAITYRVVSGGVTTRLVTDISGTYRDDVCFLDAPNPPQKNRSVVSKLHTTVKKQCYYMLDG